MLDDDEVSHRVGLDDHAQVLAVTDAEGNDHGDAVLAEIGPGIAVLLGRAHSLNLRMRQSDRCLRSDNRNAGCRRGRCHLLVVEIAESGDDSHARVGVVEILELESSDFSEIGGRAPRGTCPDVDVPVFHDREGNHGLYLSSSW